MKRLQSVGFILSVVTGLLVIMLVYIFVDSAIQALVRQRETKHVLAVARIARDIVSVRQTYRVEMGVVDASLTEPLPANDDKLRTIAAMHKGSRAQLTALTNELRDSALIGSVAAAAKIDKLGGVYDGFIPQLIAAERLPVADRPKYLSDEPRQAIYRLINAIDAELTVLTEDMSSYDPFISKMMGVSDMTWRLRADAGSERRTVASIILGAKPPTPNQLRDLNYTSGRIDSLFSAIQTVSAEPSFPATLRSSIQDAHRAYFESYRNERDRIVNQLGSNQSVPLTFPQWLELSSPGLDSLMAISAKALDLTEMHAHENVRESTRSLFGALILTLVSLGLGAIGTIHLIRHVIRPLRAISKAMAIPFGHGDSLQAHYEGRNDEIGQFARSLKSFRESTAESRRLEIELDKNRLAKETAEASSRVRAEFLANMSHELRTPLNAILGFSEMIEQEIVGKIGNERYLGYAGDIYKSGSHLLDLINDVLDLSKIDAGKMDLNESEFSVDLLIRDAVSLMCPRATHVNLHVSEKSEDAFARADRRLTKQIVLNLLSNALKFTESGEVSIECSVNPAEQIQISVSDTGIGMTDEELAKAFQQYGQVDSRISKRHHGTGLGLPLSKGLAELQGGSLVISTVAGLGTTATLILPKDRLAARSDAA